MREFVAMLSTLTLPSTRAIAGLWAELWLITLAADHNAAVAAWHANATDRFDFSFAGHFVEVKATEGEERSHEFSYDQLRRNEMPVKVASLGLRRAQSGKSLADLGVWAAEGIEIAEEKFEAPESRWLDFSDQGNGAATPKNAGF